MSFGTFASKYSTEPQVPMDISIEHEHPDTFMIDEGEVSDVLPPSAEPTITPPLEMPEIPWSLVIPAAIIGVVAIGVGWYLTKDKKPELPI